jgi:hypothetical protein
MEIKNLRTLSLITLITTFVLFQNCTKNEFSTAENSKNIQTVIETTNESLLVVDDPEIETVVIISPDDEENEEQQEQPVEEETAAEEVEDTVEDEPVVDDDPIVEDPTEETVITLPTNPLNRPNVEIDKTIIQSDKVTSTYWTVVPASSPSINGNHRLNRIYHLNESDSVQSSLTLSEDGRSLTSQSMGLYDNGIYEIIHGNQVVLIAEVIVIPEIKLITSSSSVEAQKGADARFSFDFKVTKNTQLKLRKIKNGSDVSGVAESKYSVTFVQSENKMLVEGRLTVDIESTQHGDAAVYELHAEDNESRQQQSKKASISLTVRD